MTRVKMYPYIVWAVALICMALGNFTVLGFMAQVMWLITFSLMHGRMAYSNAVDEMAPTMEMASDIIAQSADLIITLNERIVTLEAKLAKV